MKSICRICRAEEDHRRWWAKETFLKTGHEFPYFECSRCGTVQIERIPENLGDYYTEAYYSFSDLRDGKDYRGASKFKKTTARLLLPTSTTRPKLPYVKGLFPGFFREFQRFGIHLNSNILDLGCGNGALLKRLRTWGFTSLEGVDPYLKDEIRESGFILRAAELSELDKTYDWIMMHHAFEHVLNPLETLQTAAGLLAPQGVFEITIPVAGGYGWRRFGPQWFAFDPPRHLHLLTLQAMVVLSNQLGLELAHMVYSPDEECFRRSLKNMLTPVFGKMHHQLCRDLEMLDLKNETRKHAQLGDSDVVTFYLQKIIHITGTTG